MNQIKYDKLKAIRDQVLKCQDCLLYKTRKYPVIGEGNHDAQIMFVGEGPGEQEDLTGCPFVGSAGKVLDQLLISIGLKRSDIYICNLIKCRPPYNRNPLIGETEACGKYLKEQIKIIEPKIVVALGKFAMDFLFQEYGIMDRKNYNYIGKFKAQVFEAPDFKIIPQYHPAAAVYHASNLPVMIQDFQKIKEVLENL
jgi:DNA polymerase